MKIELRNITLNNRLSEETPAYTATLFVDGVRAADIKNHGHGGCDMVRWVNPETGAKVEAYFAAMPKKVDPILTLDGKPFQYQPDLETWCHTTVYRAAEMKRLKRAMATKVIGIRNGKVYEWKRAGVAPCQLIDIVLKQAPGAVILNGMSDNEISEALDGVS